MHSCCRIKCFQQDNSESAASKDMPERQENAADNVLGSLESKTTGTGSSFLAKLIIVLGIALTITLVSIGLRQSNQGFVPGHYLSNTLSSSPFPTTADGFTFKAFGYKIMLPAYAPGYDILRLNESFACSTLPESELGIA